MTTPDHTPLVPAPEIVATHVILNCFLSTALQGSSGHSLSGIRILMMLNQVDPSESTSQFRGSSFMRYPPEPLPQLQKSAPIGVVVAHYHVPPAILQCLDEDRQLLKDGGIEWNILPDNMDGLYVVNHRPTAHPGGKKGRKAHALEVRDGLLTCPSISQLLDSLVILNHWDVVVRPKLGVNTGALAASLENLDNYLLLDGASSARAFPSQKIGVCHDPDILVFYPLHLLPSYILSVAASISPVQSHQDLGKPGSLLVRFQQMGVATLLYGLRFGTPSGPISFSCGDGSQDAMHEKQAGLVPLAPLPVRQALFPCQPPAATLSLANLQLCGAVSGNGVEGGGTPPPL